MSTATTVSLIAAVGWGVAFGSGRLLIVGAVVASILVVVFCCVAARWQWVGLFAAMSLLPLAHMGIPQWLLTLSPWGFLVIAMTVVGLTRSPGEATRSRAVLVAAAPWAAWLVVCVTTSKVLSTSAGWLISFVLLVAMPVVLAARRPDPVRTLRTIWPALGAVLGAYAAVETYVVGANPLAGLLYSGGSFAEQTWSGYRATTTLGHPLENGVYFSLGFVLALDAFRRGASRWMLPAAGLNMVGVLASGSRSALVACGLGFLILGVSSLWWRRPAHRQAGHPALRAAAMWFLAAAAAAAVPFVLAARLGSLEADRSGAFRVRQIPVALDAMHSSPVVGIGPGVASQLHESLLRSIGGAGAFESYWLELLVASGIVGLVLAVLFYVTTILSCLRTADWGGAALVAAWLVNATTVNALEASRSTHLLLGVALALAVSGLPEGERRGRGRPQPQIQALIAERHPPTTAPRDAPSPDAFIS